MKRPASLSSIVAASTLAWKPAFFAGALLFAPTTSKALTAIEVNTTQAGSAGATVVGAATSPLRNYMVDTYLATELRKPLNNVSDIAYGNADLGNIVAAGSYDDASHLELGFNGSESTLYRVNNSDGQVLNTWNLGNVQYTGVTSKIDGKAYLGKPDGAVFSFDFSKPAVNTGRTIGAGNILADAYTLQGTSAPRFLAVNGYSLLDYGVDGSHNDYVTTSFVGSFSDAVLNTHENLTPASAQQVWGAYNAGGCGVLAGYTGFRTASGPVAGTYAAWQQSNFTGAELANNPQLCSPTACTSGIPHLLDYAFGLKRGEPIPSNRQTVSVEKSPTVSAQSLTANSATTDQVITLTYVKPPRTDIRYEIEGSSDLKTWSTTDITDTLVSTDPVTGFETRKGTHPLGTNGAYFLRVNVSVR